MKLSRIMSEDEISIISLPSTSSNKNENKEGIDTQRNGMIEKSLAIWNIGYVFAVLAFCSAFASTLTLIPRTNSIFYQSHLFDFNLPVAFIFLLDAANMVLPMATFFREKTLQSIHFFLRMYAYLMILWIVPYLIAYVIWCNFLNYNWPIPFLGYNYLILFITTPVGLWFVFPYELRCNNEFVKNVKMYLLYYAIQTMMSFLTEGISFLFYALPPNLQWIVAITIAFLKHVDKWLSTKVISKMTGGRDEASRVLLGVKINAVYSYFVAVRIFGAETTTVCFFIAIDFLQQLHMSYNIVHWHSKIDPQGHESRIIEKRKLVQKLALAEVTETFTPIVFAIGFAMAYYGPNSGILGNVGNDYWDYKKVDNVEHLFRMMLLHFGMDSFSLIVNAFILRNLTDVNLNDEVGATIKKYWLFMATHFGISMCINYAVNDINLGMDTTGQWLWITKEGRLRFINDSTELSIEEKAMLLSG